MESILTQRERLVADIALLRARGDTSRFIDNAQQLLTRWWSDVELERTRGIVEERGLADPAGEASRGRGALIGVTVVSRAEHGMTTMVSPLEIMPVLALALAIVFIPLLSDGPPQPPSRRRPPRR